MGLRDNSMSAIIAAFCTLMVLRYCDVTVEQMNNSA